MHSSFRQMTRLPLLREGTFAHRHRFPSRIIDAEGDPMARKYSRGAAKKVKRAMHKRKRGTLRSGRSGRKVKSRKQAIAIGLSEARRSGAKVPKKRKSKR
jgi:hypothetical protein